MEEEWMRVLCGTIENLDALPEPASKVIRVYLCSNGTDTVEERTALTQQVYPELREYCRLKYGLEFQVVDPRCSQKKTWPDIGEERDICKWEIRQCQELSLGPSFVALIGQRYGDRPLPALIPAEHFESICVALAQHPSRATRDAALLDQWYRKDDNCLPPVYRLLPPQKVVAEPPSDVMKILKGEPEEPLDWDHAQVALRRLLWRGLDYSMMDGNIDDTDARYYFLSDFEKEIEQGILRSTDPHNNCQVFTREIADLKNYVSHPEVINFTEGIYDEHEEKFVVNEESETLLATLKEQKLNRCLPNDNMRSFQILWKHDAGVSAKHHKEYLAELCETFKTNTMNMVDRVAHSHTQTSLSPLLTEVTQHWLVAKEQCRTFVGTEDLLEIIKSYVVSTEEKPLVVHGERGIGKTATMTKAASQAASWMGSDPVCILRILGSTAASRDIRQTLHSVCTQINTALDKSLEDIPNDYFELQQYFIAALDNFPKNRNLVLFLDSLDMLVPQYNAHLLSWLPQRLQENVKIVLSTLPGTHGTLDRLKNAIDNENNFVEMQPLTGEECANLVQSLLRREGRVLRSEQQEKLGQAFQTCSLPICAHFLLSEARHWASWDTLNAEALPQSMKEHMDTFFTRLENKHGRIFVTHALAYLTASSTGLSDCEVEDILSLDDTVLNDLFGKEEPAVRRLPPFLWLRLKYDLRDFLLRREAEGVTVSFWKHHLLIEAARNRYLQNGEMRREIHSALANYNLGVWHGVKKVVHGSTPRNNSEAHHSADRLVPSQPLIFKTSDGETRYNKRKYDQVPRHLFLANRLTELNEKVLFSYEWLYSKAKALSLEHVLVDFVLNPGVEATLVERALRDAQPFISTSINAMAPELSGRLLSYYNSHPNIRKLINECDTIGVKHCALVPNFPYHQIPGSPLRYTFQCPGAPTRFALSDEQDRYLLCKESSNTTVQVLDLATGETKMTIVTSVGDLHVTPSGHRLVIVDHKTEKAIKVHTSLNGRFLGQLIPMNDIQMKPKEKYKLGKISVSDTHICLVATTDKSYLYVADIETCKFTKIQGLAARANICEITPDSRFVFTNANTTLLAYNLLTMEQVNTTDLIHKPAQVIFNSGVSKGFLINPEENKIYILIIREGYVECTYKITVCKAFPEDQITQLRMSNNEEMVLVRGSKNILVYHVGTEKILCQITRPQDVPTEFKLPRSDYTDILFTRAEFSPDDKFVIGTIFRNVYIWQVSNNRLLTSLQAPVGIINDLYIPCDRGQVVTHLEDSGVVHVWSLGDAIGHVGLLDRLTSSVSEVQLTQDDRTAFVRCQESDEVGVLNMQTGQLVDLLTHENPVSSMSITSEGDYAFVTVKCGRPNVANKIWHVTGRKIIYEFGCTPAYSVPLHEEGAIASICQESTEFNAPYFVSLFKCTDGRFEEYKYQEPVNFVLSKPFVTPEDRYLVMLSADGYDHRNAFYINPTVCAVSLNNGVAMNTYTAEDLQDRVRIRRILHIQPYTNNAYTVIVFFTNEPDMRDAKVSARGYDHCYGFMMLDVCSGVVCQVVEDFLTPSTPMNRVLFNKDASLCLDNESNIFDMGTGYFVKQLSDEPVPPRRLALNSEIALYHDKCCLYALRMSDGTCVGHVNVHGTITVVEVCNDERTILVGCKDGALMSYVLMDGTAENPQEIRTRVPSRQGQLQPQKSTDNILLRSWDKVNADTSGPPYSRSPSALLNGPNDKQLLQELKPINRTLSRPKSDTVLYTNGPVSRACVVM